MTKQAFFSYCRRSFGVTPDYPFEDDSESAVLRHADSGKWFALVMNVSRRKFGLHSDEKVHVLNLKLPVEMSGSFGAQEGVYPAYHMNKLHWISLILPDASDDTVQFLTNVSYRATQKKPCVRRAKNAD